MKRRDKWVKFSSRLTLVMSALILWVYHELHATRWEDMFFRVLNCGGGKDRIFGKGADFAAFKKVLAGTQKSILLELTRFVLQKWDCS